MGSLVEHRMAQLNESRAASIPSTKRYKEKNMVLCVARVCNPTVLGAEAGGP